MWYGRWNRNPCGVKQWNERTNFIFGIKPFSTSNHTHTHTKQLYWRYALFYCCASTKSKRNNHSRCFIFFCHHQMLLYVVLLSLFYFNWCNNVTVHRLSLVIHGIHILFFHQTFQTEQMNEREKIILEFFSWKMEKKNWVTERYVHFFIIDMEKWMNLHFSLKYLHTSHQQHIFRSIWFFRVWHSIYSQVHVYIG